MNVFDASIYVLALIISILAGVLIQDLYDTFKKNPPLDTIRTLRLKLIGAIVLVILLGVVVDSATKKENMTRERALNALHGNASSEYNVVVSTLYRELNVDKYVILAETRLDEIDLPLNHRNCRATISGAILSRTQEEWTIDSREVNITEVGNLCRASAGQLVQIGPDKYAFSLNDYDILVGGIFERYVLIASIEGSLREILTTEVSASNEGYCGVNIAPDCFQYTSQVTFEPNSDNPSSPLYDLHVSSTGTRLVDERAVPFSETTVYRFNNWTGVFEER
jgi:hypothetical protein